MVDGGGCWGWLNESSRWSLLCSLTARMPRKPITYSDQHPYHIVGRSNNRDWFDLPLNYCYGVFSNVVVKTKAKYGFEIHAFVLMDNHFHMLLSTPLANISSGMRYFMTESARGIRVKTKRINHVYGGRYKPSLITSSEYYAHCLKYVLRNPVKAGICQLVQQYHWSTISSYPRRLSSEMVPPKLGHNSLIPQNKNELISWLNTPNTNREDQQIGKGLNRATFKIKTDQISQTPIRPHLPWPTASVKGSRHLTRHLTPIMKARDRWNERWLSSASELWESGV